MTNRDVPLQPGETAVTAALRSLAGVMGWAVMHTTDGAHSATSYHYPRAGARAVDLAARSGPSWDSDELLAINEGIIRVLPLSMISELIYSGPGNICVKNGKVIAGYGADVMSRHHNHVHLAVIATFTYNGGTPVPPDDPTIPNIRGPVELHVIVDANGHATGYYIFSPTTGEIHAWGEGAKYYGRSEVVT
jgi:hypothetical protein